MDHYEETSYNRALAAGATAQYLLPPLDTSSNDEEPPTLPVERTSVQSNTSHKDEHEYYAKSEAERKTVLYLAYGSNLCNETFIGKRGIKPLSAINVQVPSLRLTFDLPGIPYIEPCFANSGLRDPNNDPPSQQEPAKDGNEKEGHDKYRKDGWHKGLIGVVYEVSLKDYAHIIATEGGGASYEDVLVDCHPFTSSDVATPVPQDPTEPPFKAHTLFAPATPSGSPSPETAGRFQRPDPSYAQASARYLKLLTDGAAERGLPLEYQGFLLSLHPYTITTRKQQAGKALFSAIWLPIITIMFMLAKMFAGEDGRTPPWLGKAMMTVFSSVWTSYDNVFKKNFGDGERTIGDGGASHGAAGTSADQWRSSSANTLPYFDDEKAPSFKSYV
nr:gamma-glutamyl cyclotransferase glik [Quercus suber]